MKSKISSKEYNKIYNKSHKIQIAKRKRKYYIKNRKKILKRTKKYGKKYYALNKEISKKKAKDYRNSHKEKILQINRRYRETHKEQINKYYRLHYAKIENKIKQSLRTRLRDGLHHNIKSQKTLDLLGCSVKFLKVYLESKFKLRMSWKNHGYYGWHIDHIKPCAKFDLSKPEEQRKCFNYKNLQPLWAKENFRKNAKYSLV